jgi:ferritin-like metal-binding protein YciE
MFLTMIDEPKTMGLQDFFIDALEEIYDAERKFTKCSAALGIAAVNEELKTILTSHSAITEKHLGHLAAILNRLAHPAGTGTCAFIVCLSDKASEMMRRTETGTALRDVAVLNLVQIIQHYKIATYGNLVTLATATKHQKITTLLEECLNDEIKTKTDLTEIGRRFIYPAAKAEDLK